MMIIMILTFISLLAYQVAGAVLRASHTLSH